MTDWSYWVETVVFTNKKRGNYRDDYGRLGKIYKKKRYNLLL